MSAIWLRINAGLLVLVLAALVAIVGVLATRAEGGPLDPPGPPASTGSGVQLPGTPITGPVTISSSGHYYLTGNITVSGAQSVIIIASSDVTLDLGGFTIRGDGTIATYGILVLGPTHTYSRIGITNGSVVGFQFGVEVSAADYARIDNVHTFANTRGFQLGFSSTLRNCTANGNGETGIYVPGQRTLIENCEVQFNGRDGVWLEGSDNYVTRTRAIRNAVSGLPGNGGIRVGGSSVVVGNYSSGNFGAPSFLVEFTANDVYDNNCDGQTTVAGASNLIGTTDHPNVNCTWIQN